jgi:proline dehydrogenase
VNHATGSDVDLDRATTICTRIVERAFRQGTRIWMDMEQYATRQDPDEIYGGSCPIFPNVGVCLQAYLYRTKDDLQSLLPLGGGIAS